MSRVYNVLLSCLCCGIRPSLKFDKDINFNAFFWWMIFVCVCVYKMLNLGSNIKLFDTQVSDQEICKNQILLYGFLHYLFTLKNETYLDLSAVLYLDLSINLSTWAWFSLVKNFGEIRPIRIMGLLTLGFRVGVSIKISPLVGEFGSEKAISISKKRENNSSLASELMNKFRERNLINYFPSENIFLQVFFIFWQKCLVV